MIQLPDDVLTGIVREARCRICNGLGFRRARREEGAGGDVSGEEPGYVDCRECHGYGIRLGVCRRLAREYAEKS